MVDRRSRRAASVAALAVAVQVASKAARDGAFLGVFDADRLPRAIMIAAGLSIVAVALMSVATRKFGPRRTVPALFLLSAALFAIEWKLWPSHPALSAMLLFGHVSCLGALLLSGFWSLVTDVFDARSARAALGIVGTGATFGGLAGGLSAERITATFGLDALLLVLAAAQIVAAVLSSRIHNGQARSADEGTDVGLVELFKSGYIAKLALLVVLIATGGGLLDYLLKSSAQAEFVDPAEITRFFGVFYTATALLAFIIQATIGRRALERFGLPATAVVLPVLILLGGMSFVAIPGLASAGFGRGGEMVMRTSLYRTAYELFFAPMSPKHRNRLKSWIDVGVERLGDGLSGALVQVLLLFEAAPRLIASAAALMAGAAIVVVIALGRGYIAELHLRLRLSIQNLADAPGTMATMAKLGLGGLDLSKVVRPAPPTEPKPAQELVASSRAQFPAIEQPLGEVSISDRFEALRSADRTVVISALELPLEPELVPVVISLLSRDSVALRASNALASVSAQHTGQLIDTLLDGDEPLSTRRRIPRILATAPSQRARQGLLMALRDRRFEIRLRAAEGMFQLRRGGGAVGAPIDDRQLSELITLELDHTMSGHVSAPLDVVDLTDGAQTTPPQLYQLFLLLALGHSLDAVTSAYRANMTGDETLRGLCLEYVTSIAPPVVRERLLAHLDSIVIPPVADIAAIEDSLISSRAAIDALLRERRR